jgi:hypothetical protein
MKNYFPTILVTRGRIAIRPMLVQEFACELPGFLGRSRGSHFNGRIYSLPVHADAVNKSRIFHPLGPKIILQLLDRKSRKHKKHHI